MEKEAKVGVGDTVFMAQPDSYYKKSIKQLNSMYKQVSQHTTTNRVFKGDIWVRDFGPVFVNNHFYFFKYQPKYLKVRDAKAIQSKFIKYFANSVTQDFTQLDIILDGGNIFFHNGSAGKSVWCTERVLEDNKQSEEELQKIFQKTFNARLVLFPEQEGDITGVG